MAEFDIDALRALVQERSVRIDFGATLNFSKGTVVETAQLYRRGKTRGGNDKWEKVGPLILPPEGGGRRELMDLLAGLA